MVRALAHQSSSAAHEWVIGAGGCTGGIIRSDCRGDALNTSAPNRAMSYRDVAIVIISIAQQASPNWTGQIDDRCAQLVSRSTVVVTRSGSAGE